MAIKMYGLQLGHFGMDIEILLTAHPNYRITPVGYSTLRMPCITHETYGPPAVGSFVGMDQKQWGQSLEKIRRYATKYEALIVPGHDECGVKQHANGSSEFVQLEYYPGVYE